MTQRERTCIGCRKVLEKQDLLRIVRSKDGTIQVDKSGKMPGRGAYVCSASCFMNAQKMKRFSSALKTTMTEEMFDRLSVEIASAFAAQDGLRDTSGNCRAKSA